ncbi:MAG: hypothetical protein KDE28_27330, partial [Anaerolineales bacterium]|nr:hypothetical protein [Anaerolineales bacterium]
MTQHFLSSPASLSNEALLADLDTFPRRHIGPSPDEAAEMLAAIGVASLDELIDEAVPETIRMARKLALPAGVSESAVLADLRELASRNK